MAKTAELITVQEIASALGVPGQADAVHDGLRADGIEIVEDWAGRPAVSFDDAKAVVDRHRKAQAEWDERQRRLMYEEDERRRCQTEFDILVGTIVPVLRRQEPYLGSAEDDHRRFGRARRAALDVLKGRHSKQAIASLQVKPVVTLGETHNASLEALEPDVRERVKAALGM